jgi:hypothetical protein
MASGSPNGGVATKRIRLSMWWLDAGPALRCPEAAPEGAQEQLFEQPVYDYFCNVTTERLTPWQAHKKYGERATCETWLDEAKNQMGMAHIKSQNFVASSLLFQCAVLAYNTVRWMVLLSGCGQLKHWEIQTVRTFLVRTAGKLLTGGKQLRLKVPHQHLHALPWSAWLNLSFIP